MTHEVAEIVKEYGSLGDGEQLEDVSVSIAGRIMLKRSSGAKLVFYDLRSNGVKIQVSGAGREAPGSAPGSGGLVTQGVSRGGRHQTVATPFR